MQPEPSPQPTPDATDLRRAIRRVLVDAAVPDALTHEGRCGPRARCPDQPADDPYPLLEQRPGGAILAFCGCHRGLHSTGDPAFADLRRCFP